MLFVVIRPLRKLFKILNGSNAMWQIVLGAWLGFLLAFLPLLPLPYGPAPLGWLVLLGAIVINCHLGTFLLFWGLGALAAMSLYGVALSIGGALDGVARFAAEVPFLYASQLSHTGHLGMTILGLLLAPLAALAMWLLTSWFRRRIQPKLLERERQIKRGMRVSSPLLWRLLGWFFGLI